MKTILIGLAMAIAVPAIAHAADAPAEPEKAEKKACCCEKMKDGKMADKDMMKGEHADHMGGEQKKN